jgi:hypothetical protein
MKIEEIYKSISLPSYKSLGSLESSIEELKPLDYNIVFPSVFANNKVLIGALKTSFDNEENMNLRHALENGGTVRLLKFANGLEIDKVPDFREIPFELLEYNPKTVTLEQIPPFVPKIRLPELYSKSFVPDALRIGQDSYLFASKYDYKNPTKTTFSIITLDQLVSTVEFYYNLQKRYNQIDADKETERQKEIYLSYNEDRRSSFYRFKFRYTDLPIKTRANITFDQWDEYTLEQKEAVSLPISIRVKPVNTKFGKVGKSMPTSYHTMYENVIDPSTKMTTRYANPKVFNYFKTFSQFLAWKILDFSVIRKGNAENANKAFQTSFGRIGASDELFAEYGIFIKRQNGATLQQVEVDDIDKSLNMSFKTFGDFSQILEQHRTVISHANLTHMYARKAIGIFVPNIPAVGISRMGGERQFLSTASHEYAHFLDYFLGQVGWYNSMNYESLEGKIAAIFRQKMQGKGGASEYFNSTIECFARAMQQYFTMRWFPDNEFGHFSMINIDRPRIITETLYYCIADDFNAHVRPVIDQWLKENGLAVFSPKELDVIKASKSAAQAQRIRIIQLKYKYKTA